MLSKIYVGWVIVTTVPELCQKCDFFPEKEDGRNFYVLEFMRTLDKMQNTSPLMCTKLEIWAQSILKVIQAFHIVHIFCISGVLAK